MPLSAVPYTYNNHACSRYHPVWWWSGSLSDWKHNHQTFQQHYSSVWHPSQASAAIKHKVTWDLWASDQESTGWLYVGMSSRRPKERWGGRTESRAVVVNTHLLSTTRVIPITNTQTLMRNLTPPPALTAFKNQGNIDSFRLWFQLLHLPAAFLQW